MGVGMNAQYFSSTPVSVYRSRNSLSSSFRYMVMVVPREVRVPADISYSMPSSLVHRAGWAPSCQDSVSTVTFFETMNAL